ncbi:MAG: hypothetical protein OES46_17730, partial [Gammaproteobacteria bacterium]|nr:hypothetical protein [Gammaproteobacteria bacterium]
MSYILEALQKAQDQHELSRTLGPAEGEARPAPVRSRMGSMVIGLGLIVTLAGPALWWYIDSANSAVGLPAAEEPVATMTPAPKKAEAVANKQAETATRTKTALPVKLLAARPAVGELKEQARILASNKTTRNSATHPSETVNATKKPVAKARMPAVEAPVSDPNNQPVDGGAVRFRRQMPDDFRADSPDMVAELKNDTRKLASTLRHARSQAIARRQEVAVILDVQQRTYRTSGLKDIHRLSSALNLKLLTAESELSSDKVGAVRFFADGS